MNARKEAKAVILTAGNNRRFAGGRVPKGLAEVDGEKVLDVKIRCLRAAGISDIAVSVGNRHEKAVSSYVRKKYGDEITLIPGGGILESIYNARWHFYKKFFHQFNGRSEREGYRPFDLPPIESAHPLHADNEHESLRQRHFGEAPLMVVTPCDSVDKIATYRFALDAYMPIFTAALSMRAHGMVKKAKRPPEQVLGFDPEFPIKPWGKQTLNVFGDRVTERRSDWVPKVLTAHSRKGPNLEANLGFGYMTGELGQKKLLTSVWDTSPYDYYADGMDAPRARAHPISGFLTGGLLKNMYNIDAGLPRIQRSELPQDGSPFDTRYAGYLASITDLKSFGINTLASLRKVRRVDEFVNDTSALGEIEEFTSTLHAANDEILRKHNELLVELSRPTNGQARHAGRSACRNSRR
ncbi:MAG: NTP transferase domain-containing protein [Candidatus Aenigmatarchaeota archaeon]|nr:MAG: NTP transferase domain-containing protein [Candidatus Aenigmarchaeota archaeon]